MQSDMKIKPKLTGAAETMLQSFYARAKYSKSKGHKFYDAKAVEIVEKLDYDFSDAEKDSKMNQGVIARTLVFDELVNDYINHHPDCTVINIACGLDTRFYRMDNGSINWYNLDLPETIDVRSQLYEKTERVTNIGLSALDPSWPKQVKASCQVLVIIEGLSMYLSREENQKLLSIIRENFNDVTVMMECLAKRWVNREDVEKSIQKTGAKFTFGADCFSDIQDIAPGFRRVKDDDITRGMIKLYPILKPFQNLSFIHKMTQKILIFKAE